MQQDTAYNAVVVNEHMYPRLCLYHFRSMTLLGQKRYRDVDTYGLQLQYRQYLVALLFTIPIPPSFHEIIFILVPLRFIAT